MNRNPVMPWKRPIIFDNEHLVVSRRRLPNGATFTLCAPAAAQGVDPNHHDQHPYSKARKSGRTEQQERSWFRHE